MKSPSYSFVAGDHGSWEILSLSAVVGESLEPVPFLEIRNEYVMQLPVDFHWLLRGVSNKEPHRDVEDGRIRPFERPASLAALIPVKKNAEWWELAAEDRKEIYLENSDRIASKLKGLPILAQTLHHCRDLGEPFDFLTWFEYSHEDAGAFEDLMQTLRGTKEWKYVEREVDVRLSRSFGSI
ncbi:MAG: chlorite dismutase [Luteolibacter sp.]